MRNHNDMLIPHFSDEDWRMLASLAIDLYVDHLEFKIVRTVIPEENYWNIDCRFAVSEEELDTWYDSFSISSGSQNKPETYQMSWTIKKKDDFNVKPIKSPLLVCFYFNQLSKKAKMTMN